MRDGATRDLLLAIACAACVATAPSRDVTAAPLAPGDLLMTCAYWGITRIEADTGEQHPLGVGNSGSYSPIVEDENGLVWVIDNRWLVSIDPETGEHRIHLQLPTDFSSANNGELLPEPGSTFLYAGDGAVSRIDPVAGSMTPLVSGAPLVNPLGLDFALNGDLLIADYAAGAVFRWNESDGISTVASGDMIVGPTRVRQIPDGDVLVIKGAPVGRPIRVHPVAGMQGTQSFYSNAIGSVSSGAFASNGDFIYANSTSSSGASVWRSTSPEATPIQLLAVGQLEEIMNAANLALTADDRVLIAGQHNEITEGVVTATDGALWILDPAAASLRVLSARPPEGGIATSADGRLFMATTNGAAPFNLREIDPRTGEPRRAAGDALFTRPYDAAVESDGHVVVLNGIPNGIPSVLRVDPDTGDTVLLSPTDQLVDPEKIVAAPNGSVFVGDFQEGVFEVSPANGAQTLVPGTDELDLVSDLDVEPGGTLLVVESAGPRMWRVTPDTGARQEVGPPLDLIQMGMEPQGFGGFSALAVGLDGTPYLSLVANSMPNDYAIYRAPTDAADTELVSELTLCRGDDLEVVKALPAPEAGSAIVGAASLACLALLVRQRAATRATPIA